MRHRLITFFFSIAFLIQSDVGTAAVVIQYHHVDTSTPSATSISPELFSQHMTYLADNAFQVWSLPRLIAALKQKSTLPDKVIAITFDDGYKSIYSAALPILQKYNFPFTVFINPDLVGGPNTMSWDELHKIVSRGATIANHTMSHPHLVRALDGESTLQWKNRIRSEISMAENIIHQKMGKSPGLLAYPYGEYKQGVEAIARSLNLVAFAQHSGAFDHSVNWQAIPRFAFGGHYTDMQGFTEKVNSLPMPLIEAVVSDGQGNRIFDPLLPMSVRRPTLSLRLKIRQLAKGIRCFASGQGRIDVQVSGSTITASPNADLPVGRSRINCTAASGQKGRFYWYSKLFMRKQTNGQWYPEQ